MFRLKGLAVQLKPRQSLWNIMAGRLIDGGHGLLEQSKCRHAPLRATARVSAGFTGLHDSGAKMIAVPKHRETSAQWQHCKIDLLILPIYTLFVGSNRAVSSWCLISRAQYNWEEEVSRQLKGRAPKCGLSQLRSS
jgi:hypothetical protein